MESNGLLPSKVNKPISGKVSIGSAIGSVMTKEEKKLNRIIMKDVK